MRTNASALPNGRQSTTTARGEAKARASDGLGRGTLMCTAVLGPLEGAAQVVVERGRRLVTAAWAAP